MCLALTLWSRPCQSRCKPSPSLGARAPGCHREEESSMYGSPCCCLTGCSWALLSSSLPPLWALEKGRQTGMKQSRQSGWLACGNTSAPLCSCELQGSGGSAAVAHRICMWEIVCVCPPKGCFTFACAHCECACVYVHSMWVAMIVAAIHIGKGHLSLRPFLYDNT